MKAEVKVTRSRKHPERSTRLEVHAGNNHDSPLVLTIVAPKGRPVRLIDVKVSANEPKPPSP